MIRSKTLGILDHFRHFSQSGLAYVAILVLLAIMSTLALAFLSKIGTLTLATANRLDGMQANYLAESAANHALWRLLNDPGFPADQTVYYMHNLDGGRYGYKVRKPTRTTFATVATVGAAGAVETHQSYVQYLKPDNILVYDKSGEAVPKYRQLLGANWSAREDTIDIGSDTVTWMVLQGAPHKKEMIMGTLDASNDINLVVWDGTSWGNLNEFTTSSNDEYRCFDITYENLSGDALVVGRYAASGDVRYNIWDGNAWAFPTAQIDANLTPGSSLQYIDMASRPNSNEIMIALVQFNNDLKVVQWDGAAFIDHGVIDTDMATGEYGSAEIVYEQQSGDALILWNHKNLSQIYYRVWSGASLGPVNLLLPFDFDATPNVIRAAADPSSDYIFVAAVDSDRHLNVAVWDGSAWSDSRELDTATNHREGQVLDVAWELGGDDVVVAWGSASASYNITYFTWRKGTALADHAVRIGPNFQNRVDEVILLPVSGTSKIIALATAPNRKLQYSLWNGSGFVGDPAVEVDPQLDLGDLNFGIAEFGTTYTGGSG